MMATTTTPAAPHFVAMLFPANAANSVAAEEWDRLATHAAEPNPFFERWALLPALSAFPEPSVSLLAVYCDPGDGNQRKLVGLAPVRQTRARGVPISVRAIWGYPECCLATPLIHRDWVVPAIMAMALKLSDGCIGRMQGIGSGGAITQALFDNAPDHGLELSSLDRYTRALCDTSTATDADSYLARSISHRHRRELRRQNARLAELGDTRFEVLTDSSGLEPWIDEFLQLEAGGWKGSAGVALGSNQARVTFFRELCRAGWIAGRLLLQSLRSNGRAVAMKCSLLAPPGAFAFKICFDEAYAKYSPGSHLDIFSVEQLYAAAPTLQWMDSCASRRRWQLDRMWSERRGMETLLIGRTRTLKAALVHVLPLVIWFRRYRGRIP